jgi:hypothetical protein
MGHAIAAGTANDKKTLPTTRNPILLCYAWQTLVEEVTTTIIQMSASCAS